MGSGFPLSSGLSSSIMSVVVGGPEWFWTREGGYPCHSPLFDELIVGLGVGVIPLHPWTYSFGVSGPVRPRRGPRLTFFYRTYRGGQVDWDVPGTVRQDRTSLVP